MWVGIAVEPLLALVDETERIFDARVGGKAIKCPLVEAFNVVLVRDAEDVLDDFE